jgi:hypothetical protein
MNELDRREALKILGLGAVVAGTGSVVLLGQGNSRRGLLQAAGRSDGETGSNVEKGPSPWWLLAPFGGGSTIGSCRVASMTGVEGGVVGVRLERRDGKDFDVYICRRDDSPGAPVPIASTDYYDFFLPNGGKGNTPTDEKNGRVVLGLALLAERNEKSRAQLPLKTLRQYWRRG